jgi:hypothetical protein
LIRLFTLRQPIVIVMLIILVFALRAPMLLHPFVSSNFTPLYTLCPALVGWFNQGYIWNYIAGSLIIFLQALHMNYVFEKHAAQLKASFLPAFFYVIYACLFIELDREIYPALLAQTPLILALDGYFGLYKSANIRQRIFNSMLFLGIGIIVYTPLLYLVLVFMVSLFFIKIPGVRDFFMVLAGSLLPLYFTFVYYYFTDNIGSFIYQLSKIFTWDYTIVPGQQGYELILLSCLGLFFIIASYKLYTGYFRNVIKTRIIQQILFILAMTSFLSMLIMFHLEFRHLFIFIIPFAFSFSNLFYGKWKLAMNEVLVLLLLVSVVIVKLYKV